MKGKKRTKSRIHKVLGTAERPRLRVYKSLRYVYAQLINDDKDHVITGISSLNPEIKKKLKSTGNKEAAMTIGEEIAKIAKEKGITKVVFDRGRFLYHGVVKELAEAARKGGLGF